jgi:hypothetical protein
MKEKIVQTAGIEVLREFAPEFAHFNDDVLLKAHFYKIICKIIGE